MANTTLTHFETLYDAIITAVGTAWNTDPIVDLPIIDSPQVPYSIVLHQGTEFNGPASGGKRVEERHRFMLIHVAAWQDDNIRWRAARVRELTAALFTGPNIGGVGFLPNLEPLDVSDNPEDRLVTVGVMLSVSTLGDHF
jgi:hypothetical protein